MDWLRVAQNVGVPFAVLLMLLAWLSLALKWTATNVVLPLVRKALEYFDRSMGAMDRIADANAAQTASLAQITGALATVNDRLNRLAPPR